MTRPIGPRHEGPIPGAVTFAGDSDHVVHPPTKQCPKDRGPHPMSECGEFDRNPQWPGWVAFAVIAALILLGIWLGGRP